MKNYILWALVPCLLFVSFILGLYTNIEQGVEVIGCNTDKLNKQIQYLNQNMERWHKHSINLEDALSSCRTDLIRISEEKASNITCSHNICENR